MISFFVIDIDIIETAPKRLALFLQVIYSVPEVILSKYVSTSSYSYLKFSQHLLGVIGSPASIYLGTQKIQFDGLPNSFGSTNSLNHLNFVGAYRRNEYLLLIPNVGDTLNKGVTPTCPL